MLLRDVGLSALSTFVMDPYVMFNPLTVTFINCRAADHYTAIR